jgi:hypothetical protein
MASAKFLRRQAATCATLARETFDEESRRRCLKLEKMYLRLADSEEQVAGPKSPLTGEGEKTARSLAVPSTPPAITHIE